MNYKIISRINGLVLISLAFMMATSMIIAGIYGESSSVFSFLIGSLITLVAGLLLVLFGRNADDTIYRRDALAIVSLSWFLGGFFAGFVFFLDGSAPTVLDGFFEAVSGLTTTGASIIRDLDAVSHASKWWRGMTNWLGGLGIIALFVAIFPQLGVGGKFLFQSEVAGPINEGLKPKIKETSTILWRIYILFTAIGIGLLMLTGVNWFDATVHTFAGIATGGFGNYNNSVSGLNNAAAEYILCLIMVTGGTNFGLFYYLIKGKRDSFLKNPEYRWYLTIIAGATLIISVYLFISNPDIEMAFRVALFQVLSIMTTTGFATTDYELWHGLPQLILAALMITGGMAGSTGGGVKVVRVMIAFRLVVHELFTEFRPQMVRVIRMGNQIINSETARSVAVFFVIALISFFANSAFLTFLGLSMEDSLGATIACLFNIGPGFGMVGPTENYADMPGAAKIALSVMMVLGRLEFVTVLTLLIPDFWRR